MFNEEIARMNHAQRQAVLSAVTGIRDQAKRIDNLTAAIVGAFRHGNDPDVDALVAALNELDIRAGQLRRLHGRPVLLDKLRAARRPKQSSPRFARHVVRRSVFPFYSRA